MPNPNQKSANLILEYFILTMIFWQKLPPSQDLWGFENSHAHDLCNTTHINIYIYYLGVPASNPMIRRIKWPKWPPSDHYAMSTQKE